MKVQVIQDDRGRATGIFIPISQWKEMKKRYQGLAEMEESDVSKNQLILELKEAIQELKMIEQGKKKSRPASELLNEL